MATRQHKEQYPIAAMYQIEGSERKERAVEMCKNAPNRTESTRYAVQKDVKGLTHD